MAQHPTIAGVEVYEHKEVDWYDINNKPIRGIKGRMLIYGPSNVSVRASTGTRRIIADGFYEDQLEVALAMIRDMADWLRANPRPE